MGISRLEDRIQLSEEKRNILKNNTITPDYLINLLSSYQRESGDSLEAISSFIDKIIFMIKEKIPHPEINNLRDISIYHNRIELAKSQAYKEARGKSVEDLAMLFEKELENLDENIAMQDNSTIARQNVEEGTVRLLYFAKEIKANNPTAAHLELIKDIEQMQLRNVNEEISENIKAISAINYNEFEKLWLNNLSAVLKTTRENQNIDKGKKLRIHTAVDMMIDYVNQYEKLNTFDEKINFSIFMLEKLENGKIIKLKGEQKNLINEQLVTLKNCSNEIAKMEAAHQSYRLLANIVYGNLEKQSNLKLLLSTHRLPKYNATETKPAFKAENSLDKKKSRFTLFSRKKDGDGLAPENKNRTTVEFEGKTIELPPLPAVPATDAQKAESEPTKKNFSGKL